MGIARHLSQRNVATFEVHYPGHRDDGTPLAGDYITGQTREVPGDRRFVKITS